VLREVKAQQPSNKGMPGYANAELVAMIHAVADGPNRLRNVAVLWTELHGFRAKEVRLLPLRKVVMPTYGERGVFIIDAESGTKRGLQASERFRWSRSASTSVADGPDTSEPGMSPCSSRTTAAHSVEKAGLRWHSGLRRQIAKEDVPFKQHRLRSTCARRLHEAGYQDTAIMEILGWSSVAMLRRYLGKIPVAQLKRLPTTLERVFGRAI
jgi:hypothetical protein